MNELEQKILERLSDVIDPETNTDVIRMRLVEDLIASAEGSVSYTFRPSSFVCPIAVTLALDIRAAVKEVPGVTKQTINVAGFLLADELIKILDQE